MASQITQYSASQTIQRPKWTIALIAALTAASVQAPLIDRSANESTVGKSPIASTAGNKNAETRQGVAGETKENKALAFEDKNRTAAFPEKRKLDSKIASPVVFDPPPLIPIEPPDRPRPGTGFLEPPDIANGFASGGIDAGYIDPLPNGPPTVPAGDPITENGGGGVTAPGHDPVESGAPSTVPEPGSISTVLFAAAVSIRRRQLCRR